MAAYKFPSCLEYPIAPGDYWAALTEASCYSKKERDGLENNRLNNSRIMDYAEQKRLSALSWKDILTRALKKDNEAQVYATIWHDDNKRGPLGELVAELDRDEYGAIIDEDLADINAAFIDAVSFRRWTKALRFYSELLDHENNALQSQKEDAQSWKDEEETHKADQNWGRLW